jgi:hypothetical protein
MATHLSEILQTPESEWMTFPGGELEGRRPKRLCEPCRTRLRRLAADRNAAADGRQPLCFQCYRLELDRERALEAAGQLDTASEARFQDGLPFEPVNQVRLSMLKADRAAARVVARAGTGRFVDRRRRAQIAARHALQAIAAGLRRHQLSEAERERALAGAVHAAELQFPESWLPFVVSR